MQDQKPQQVVAIDGPSGSGKSTVARALAQRLNFRYLDTGAMYRAVTWYFLREQVADDLPEAELQTLLQGLELQLDDGRVFLNGADVTSHLRSQEVESRVSAVSALRPVRRAMRDLQRQEALRGPLVAEGRDMTTVVFPGARWKFYLDARPEERARRRCGDFQAQGREVSQAEVQEEMAVRDHLDSHRQDAPLTRASDAVYLDTTALSREAVVQRMLAVIQGEVDSGDVPV